MSICITVSEGTVNKSVFQNVTVQTRKLLSKDMQMASENGKNADEQMEELYAWIATIPFSKLKKNLTRDFSDAVLMAEVLKVYYPRYVDLHNYVPASNINTKKENWNLLNRKVLSKVDMRLSKETIQQLANSYPGAAEHLLSELKTKILKEFQDPQNPSCETTDKDKNDVSNVETADERDLNASRDSVNGLEILEPKVSIFVRTKQRLFFVVKWLLNWCCIWNYFPSFWKIYPLKSPFRFLQKRHVNETIEETKLDVREEEETIPQQAYLKVKKELEEKENVICMLNHKVAYLESAMKLNDLRISNLTSQILQNAVENEQSLKTQANINTQAKLRPRFQNVWDTMDVDE